MTDIDATLVKHLFRTQFPQWAELHVVPVENKVAVDAARIRLTNKLALADSLILATARSVGGRVVTGDSDMKGLRDVVFLR